MIDRKILVEKEIEKLKDECAKMYLKIILSESTEVPEEYEKKKRDLASLESDLSVIDHLMKKERL